MINKIHKKEIMMFSKKFSILLETGVPLLKALDIIISKTKNHNFKKILIDIQQKIGKGFSISECFEQYKNVFGDYYIAMMKTGEETGELCKILNSLYEYLFNAERLRKKMINLCIYPSFIFVALIFAFTFFSIKIMPSFEKMFEGVGVSLPAFTKMVFGSINVIKNHIILILIIIASIIIIFKLLLRNNRFRYLRDYFLIKIPIIGNVLLNYQVIVACRSLHICIVSGINLPETLEITINNTTNTFIKQSLVNVLSGVMNGIQMSEVLNDTLFPDIFKEMVEIGEESGKLDDSLERTYLYYEWELENFVNNLDKWIEPISIVILGIFVAIFVFSIALPVIQISSGDLIGSFNE